MRIWIPLTWRKGDWVDVHGAAVQRPLVGLLVRAHRTTPALGVPTLTIRISYVALREHKPIWRRLPRK